MHVVFLQRKHPYLEKAQKRTPPYGAYRLDTANDVKRCRIYFARKRVQSKCCSAIYDAKVVFYRDGRKCSIDTQRLFLCDRLFQNLRKYITKRQNMLSKQRMKEKG